MKVIGVDLAGKETNPTGLAVYSSGEFKTKLVKSDDKILRLCLDERPALVAIDAPLSFPKKGHLRRADSELIARGHRVLPPTLGGMKSLTQRGIQLAKKLRERGFEVIEIHPRTSGKILFGTPEREEWISEFERMGLKLKPNISEHEIDGILAALTALLYLQEKTEEAGEPEEGTIVIPRERLKIF